MLNRFRLNYSLFLSKKTKWRNFQFTNKSCVCIEITCNFPFFISTCIFDRKRNFFHVFRTFCKKLINYIAIDVLAIQWKWQQIKFLTKQTYHSWNWSNEGHTGPKVKESRKHKKIRKGRCFINMFLKRALYFVKIMVKMSFLRNLQMLMHK